MGYIPLDSSGPDVNNRTQPEQAGRDGGEGDNDSREEASSPVTSTSGAATDGVSSAGREDPKEPLRWWLEVVGAGEVSPANRREDTVHCSGRLHRAQHSSQLSRDTVQGALHNCWAQACCGWRGSTSRVQRGRQGKRFFLGTPRYDIPFMLCTY